MARVSALQLQAIGKEFGYWLSSELERLGVTAGMLVAATRRWRDTGPELSYSALKRLMAGLSVPTPETVVYLTELLSALRPTGPSILIALERSYPSLLIRIMVGLTHIGNSGYVSRHINQANPRWNDYRRSQRRVCKRFGQLIEPYLPPRSHEKLKTQDFQAIREWLLDLSSSNSELLAVVVGRSYLTRFGTREDLALREILDVHDRHFEELYRKALQVYPLRAHKPNSKYGFTKELLEAERILENINIRSHVRLAAMTPLLEAYESDFADEFSYRIWGRGRGWDSAGEIYS